MKLLSVLSPVLIALSISTHYMHARSLAHERSALYQEVAPVWFNEALKDEWQQIQTQSLPEQIEWLRAQRKAFRSEQQKRDRLYGQFVHKLSETERYNYMQRPTLREQVAWLERYRDAHQE
jgi:hypothetical protein